MLTLGQKIKAARKELGLTQAELVGDRITRNQLSLIENSINNPSIPTLEFLAERLGKPVSYFLSDDDFLKHECINLVAKCENFNKRNDYGNTVNSLEAFLSSINPGEFSFRETLGKIYALLGEAYLKTDDERAEATLLEAVKYLDEKDNYIYVCTSYVNIGINAYKKGDYEKAEKYYTKANSMLNNVTLDDIVLKLNITYNLAQTYTKLRKYSQIIPFVNEILEYSQKYKIYHNFGEFKMLLANAYFYSNNYKEAINCTLKAIEYFIFSSDDLSKYRCFTNLGIFYRHVKDYSNSLKYLDQAISYFKVYDNHSSLINAKAEKIKTLFFMSENTETIKSMIGEIFNFISDSMINKADLLTILGIINLENKEIDDALNLFVSAEDIFNKTSGSEFSPYAYIGLSKIYKHSGNWEKAYSYLSKANESNFEASFKFNFE